MKSLTLHRSRLLIAAGILLIYLAGYGLLRTGHIIVHRQGAFFHDVSVTAAGGPSQISAIDLLYVPLRTAERTAWHVTEPLPACLYASDRCGDFEIPAEWRSNAPEGDEPGSPETPSR